VRDEALAELLQRPLRKRRLLGPHVVQHHLPAQIQHRQLDGLGIRDAQVALDDDGHAKQRWGDRIVARPRASVHVRQLLLKCLVEELVSVHSEECEKLAGTLETLEDELLLLRRLHPRMPGLHRQLLSPPRDHRSRALSIPELQAIEIRMVSTRSVL
jgi:hypothetical protein